MLGKRSSVSHHGGGAFVGPSQPLRGEYLELDGGRQAAEHDGGVVLNGPSDHVASIRERPRSRVANLGTAKSDDSRGITLRPNEAGKHFESRVHLRDEVPPVSNS